MDVLKTRLVRTLGLTNALAEGLTSDNLLSHNGQARSNTIGAQFWCVVGARESYGRAFAAGAWQGFACRLDDIAAPEAVQAALAASKDDLLARVSALADADLNEARQAMLVDLIEHEAQHHGQLIRYFYANDLAFPREFADRYAL